MIESMKNWRPLKKVRVLAARAPALPPTVAEASAFVAAAIAASPKPDGTTAEASTSMESRADAATRLAALLEERPTLKVVKRTKNNLTARELAGLSDDDEETDGKDGCEAAKVAADEIRHRREARLEASRQSLAARPPASAQREEEGLSNSTVPLTIDLT